VARNGLPGCRFVGAPFSVTKEGFEQTLAIDYYGHVLLTLLLLPRMISSGRARVINTIRSACVQLPGGWCIQCLELSTAVVVHQHVQMYVCCDMPIMWQNVGIIKKQLLCSSPAAVSAFGAASGSAKAPCTACSSIVSVLQSRQAPWTLTTLGACTWAPVASRRMAVRS